MQKVSNDESLCIVQNIQARILLSHVASRRICWSEIDGKLTVSFVIYALAT